MRVLILAPGVDTNGTAARIAAAFRRWRPELDVSAVAGRRTPADHPTDLDWFEPHVAELYAAADLVQFQNSLGAYRRLDLDRAKPIVLAHHGVFLRTEPERATALAQAIGAVQTVSTVDLLADAPGSSWVASPYDLEYLASIRRAAGGRDPSRLRVALAPTSRALKGTAFVLGVLEGLAAELPLEVDLIEGVPWAECLTRKAAADLVVDQLALGYGGNAVEAWAMGLPVVAGFADPADAARGVELWGELPFENTGPAELEAELRRLLGSADARAEAAGRGLAHVRAWHDERVVVERLAELWRGVPASAGSGAVAGWTPPPVRPYVGAIPRLVPARHMTGSIPAGAVPLMRSRRGRAGYKGSPPVYDPEHPGLAFVGGASINRGADRTVGELAKEGGPSAQLEPSPGAPGDASAVAAGSGSGLWFVTPAWRRFELSAVCFEQRARVIARLGELGLEAHCVVVADDANLELAQAAGFATVERDNAWLGRRFNDGIEFAGRAGADWIVPIGSDSWILPDYFLPLPAAGLTLTSQLYAVVAAERLAELRVRTRSGAGPYVFPRAVLEPSGFRPARDQISRGVDHSTLAGIRPAARFVARELSPLQYVGFRGVPHLTPYGTLVAAWGRRELEDPWPELVAAGYDRDLVDRARLALGAAIAA